MARKSQREKMLNGKIQCKRCKVWKLPENYKLVKPVGKSSYRHFACFECVGYDDSDSVESPQIAGWPCQYCPKRPTCKTECFIYKQYVEGDIVAPATIKKFIEMMT